MKPTVAIATALLSFAAGWLLKPGNGDGADETGSAGGQAAGASVGGVAVLADDAADEVARLIRHVVTPVEDAGDGRDGHACLLRDLADRGPLRGSLRHLAHSSTFRNVPERICTKFHAICEKRL